MLAGGLWRPVDFGNGNGKRSAMSRHALCGDFASVCTHQGARNCQAHTGATGLLLMAAAAVELLEDQRQVMCVDPRTIIRDHKFQSRLTSTALKKDVAGLRRVACGVFQQMAERPADQMRIEPAWIVPPFNLVWH